LIPGRRIATPIYVGEESPDSSKAGDGVYAPTIKIAGVLIFYSHAVLGTNSELTEFESSRNE